MHSFPPSPYLYLYESPVAAVKNYHNFGSLTQQNLSSQVSGAQNSNMEVTASMYSLETPGKNTACFFQLLVAVGIPWLPWLVVTGLHSVSTFALPSLCVSSHPTLDENMCHWI